MADMTLRSSAFEDGGAIPGRYTCDGEDVSPPLAWDGVPQGTQELALIVTDPDARGFVHWALAGIPADAGELAEGKGDEIGTPGPNGFGRTGWGGPCPPSGEHRYEFRLYALSGTLTPSGAPTAEELRRAMEGQVLGEALLTGVYSRR